METGSAYPIICCFVFLFSFLMCLNGLKGVKWYITELNIKKSPFTLSINTLINNRERQSDISVNIWPE